MGLGNRSARRHETAKTAGVNPEDYWDFKPGQTVMTVDGFLGQVTAVHDGPLAGTETYDVTLVNGLGGGEYTASQLRASSTSTAVSTAVGDEANTASLDYPELAEVLVQRPDPGKYPSLSHRASLQVQADLLSGQESNEGGKPGVCDNGHLTWGGVCPACRDTEVSQNAMVVNEGDHKPNPGVHASKTADWMGHHDDSPYNTLNYQHGDHGDHTYADDYNTHDGCTVCGDSDHDTHEHVDDSVRSEIDGLFGPGAHSLIKEQPGRPTKYSAKGGCTICGDSDHKTPDHDDEAHPDGPKKVNAAIERGYGFIRQAMADRDFGFHIVATWNDVRNKARRIRTEGGVHITQSEGGMVVAHVKGEHDTYESVLLRAPGTQKIAQWDCACPWAKYHWGAPDDYSRFAGRMCSHALALNFEAQSRGMFGKEVSVDAGAPRWLKQKDMSLTSSLDIPDCGPVHVFAALALSQGEDREELAFLLSRIASVSSPLGEPAGNTSPPEPGPTKPVSPNENPASAGFLTASDPENWGQQGPSMGGTFASLHDDAVFEPEQVTVHTAGPAALIAPLVRTIGPMVVKHVMNRGGGGDEEGEEGGGSSTPGMAGKVNEVAQGIKAWTDRDAAEGESVRQSMTGSRAELHESPEPALPSTDSDLDDSLDVPGRTWSGYAGDPEPDQSHTAAADQSTCSHNYVHNLHGQCTNCGRTEETEGDEPCDHEWCVANEAPHTKDEHDMAPPAHLDPHSDASRDAEQSMRDAFGGDEDHSWLLDHQHQGPSKFSSISTGVEYAVPADQSSGAGLEPSTDFKTDPTSLEPEDPSFVSTGSVADIVADFQRTAGAASLDSSGAAPATSGDTSDIAAAARAYLAEGDAGLNKVAMAVFTPGEQQQLINEGEGTARAANLDRLEITGTHYESLDALGTDDEEGWLS